MQETDTTHGPLSAPAESLGNAPSEPALDPRLQALAERLRTALADDRLTLDATVFGQDGAAFTVLLRTNLGVEALTVSGKVAIAVDGSSLTLAADRLDDTVAGVTQTPVSVRFGADDQGLTLLLRLDGDAGWTLETTWPRLAPLWIGSLAFAAANVGDIRLVLANRDRIDAENAVPMTAGLHLTGSVDAAGGAAASIAALIPGLDPTLPVAGSISIRGDTQGFHLTGGLPDFRFSPPLMPELAFRSPGIHAVATLDAAGMPTNAAYIEARADVACGGATLPLAVRLPNAAQGWQMGVSPGGFVPLADLATFFGAFPGLGLLAALPSAVQGIKTFGLRYFSIQTTKNITEFQRLSLAIGTDPAKVDQALWTIIPGKDNTPILALSDLSFFLSVVKRNEDTRTSGRLSGTFKLADALSLRLQLPLPLDNGTWTLSTTGGGELPNLKAFARLLGGQSLAAMVPKGICDLTSYTLEKLTLVYNPGPKKLTRFALGLASSRPWTIIKNQLAIENLRLRLSASDPLGDADVTGYISGAISLGEASVLVEVSRPVSGDPWRLNVVSESVDLPDLGELADLAGGDVSSLVPEEIRDNGFTLSGLYLQADLSAQTMERLGFMLSTEDTWPIIADVLAVTEVGISLDLDWTATPSTRTTSGSIWGSVCFCQADFLLQADLADQDWTLSMQLAKGGRLTLEHLADAFGADLWAQLSDLGVPNIALTSASATYETATGSYSFEGTVDVGEKDDRWTIPVGITDIGIESLGGAVSCTCGPDGAVTDKNVFVTGVFSIGNVRFTVRYQAGGDLGIDCSLVGGDPVTVNELIADLCHADAGKVTWTSGVEALDEISIRDASARIILGDAPAFQLSGTMTLGGGTADAAECAALFVVAKVEGKWEFALAVRIHADWSLPGFSDVFRAFKINRSSWMLAASSFTSTAFHFPAEFPTPTIAGVERGLDFYGEITAGDTLDTMKSVIAVLPEGSVAETLTVHGHLADPLSSAYLEVLLAGGANGTPLMGWDAVRVGTLSLRLTGAPSFALHGDLLLRTIKNPDGSVFHLILDLAVSLDEISIIFEKQPGGDAIFTWSDAFGIDALEIALTDLALGITFKPPALDGTVGGRVAFEYSADPVNTLLRNAPPAPTSVRLMQSRRVLLAATQPERYGDHLGLDYARAYDQDGMKIEMLVSFLIVAGTPPVPYPYRLAGRFINFTLPYLLKRFAKVDIPSVLMPIQFPDVTFDLTLPNPAKPGSAQDLKFLVKGTVVIFGLHCAIDAEFDETRIKFIANADPIVFKVDNTVIVAIIKEKKDSSHGPDLIIDSKPAAGQPQIGGDFHCNFFDFVDFGGSVDVAFDAGDPTKSRFRFRFQGDVGKLANFSLALTYQDTNYLAAVGTFHLGVAVDLPGFSMQGVRVADKIDLSKYTGEDGVGVDLAATLALRLDARQPSNPDFAMHVDGSFRLYLSACCSFDITLGLDLDVGKDTMAELPGKIVEAMAENVEELFGALLSSIECFQLLLQLGIFVLEEAAKISKVLVVVFGADLATGASVLHDLGKQAEDAADSLWSVFDSHNSKENTKAMKHGGYSSKETGKSVKDTEDRHGATYTASELVRDQACAGYDAPQVTGGLCDTFPMYSAQPVAAGQLLADPSLTSFSADAVACALKAQYPRLASADDMADALMQIYKAGAALGPQEMADTLAPLYDVADVAQVLHRHYADETRTAEVMAGYLVSAYQKAGASLTAESLGTALAPLYPARETAPTLHAAFSADTDTVAKLSALLQQVYMPSSPIDAPAMASGLGAVFAAKDVVPELQHLYPDDTATAAETAALLTPAYPDMRATDMAAALAVGLYPAKDIADVLFGDFHGDVDTPARMGAILAGHGGLPIEVAPILKELYPAACATAADMTGILFQVYGETGLDVSTLAKALAAASFTAVEIAPYLRSDDMDTPAKMAALLQDVYTDPAIDLTTMLAALAAGRFNALDNAPVALALYPVDAPTLATALVEAMATTVPLRPLTLGVILINTDFDAANAAKGVKAGFPSITAGRMAAVLLLAGDADLPSMLHQAAASRDAGDSLDIAAKAIVKSRTNTDGALLITALDSSFPSPECDIMQLMKATVTAFDNPDLPSLAKGLFTDFAISFGAAVTLLERVCIAAGQKNICYEFPIAIANAFQFLGQPVPQTSFAISLASTCGPMLSTDSLANALIKVFGSQVTAASMIRAFRAAFKKSNPALDVFTASFAIRFSLTPAPSEAAPMLQAVVEAFDLNRLPGDAGSMAMSLWIASFDRSTARTAMTRQLADKWTPQISDLVDSVYAEAAWGTGRKSRQLGLTVQQAAIQIRSDHFDCSAMLMVRVLTDIYQLIRPADAIRPIAEALSGRGYSLNEISAAMTARFTSDWTSEDWSQFLQYYKQ